MTTKQLKRARVTTQLRQASNGTITCGCGGTLPTRFAYRCYYCGEFYCRACAPAHFGGDRAEHNAANEAL